MISARRNYKVVALSSSRNGFGLRGMVIVARNGDAWEVATNDLNARQVGSWIGVAIDGNGEPSFAVHGWEVPRRLDNSQKVI